jgi:hypothetical protein
MNGKPDPTHGGATRAPKRTIVGRKQSERTKGPTRLDVTDTFGKPILAVPPSDTLIVRPPMLGHKTQNSGSRRIRDTYHRSEKQNTLC